MSQHRKMKTLPPLSSDPCRSHSWDLDPVVDQLSWKRSRIHDVGLAQDLMKDLQCGLEQFNDRIIFMSMYSDIVWRDRKRQYSRMCSELAGFLAVVGHSWDLDQKRHGTRTVLINQTEIWTELQQ